MTESERRSASEKYYQELREKLDERVREDRRLNTLSRKIAENTADFNDTAQYSELVSNHIAAVLQENIGEINSPLAKEFVCTELLKDQHSAINETLGRVQVSIDEKNGIHIAPQKAPFPFERVRQVAHALEDPTVKPETILRRANAPVANVAKSFHDDYIRANAKLRNDLGLKPVIQRYGANCCAWCSAVAGKYRFGEQPEDIFRRHDNCDCVIIYDTQVLRGKQTADGGRSKTWEEVDPSDIMQNPPATLSQEEAENLQNTVLQGLTLAGRRDIMRVSGAISGALNPDSTRADEHAKRYYEAVRKMSTDVKRISENTGYSEDLIQSIKDFVFNEKHDLGDRIDYFAPDYKMAESWQRLIDGKGILPHDITLLRHEEMERNLMKQGFSQEEAHKLTSAKYNYDKEAREFYDKANKDNKK